MGAIDPTTQPRDTCPSRFTLTVSRKDTLDGIPGNRASNPLAKAAARHFQNGRVKATTLGIFVPENSVRWWRYLPVEDDQLAYLQLTRSDFRLHPEHAPARVRFRLAGVVEKNPWP